MTVGLLGGSFDPPHQGHVHITRQALKRFGLDRVWWLVTPGNPLKEQGPAALSRRMDACHTIMQHPRVEITDIERHLGTRYTAETLAALQFRYPGVRFVWLMGADNLGQFHHWNEWQSILGRMPIGILARPGEQVRAGLSRAARQYDFARLPAAQARALPFSPAPRWCMVPGPMVDLSSTAIRRAGHW